MQDELLDLVDENDRVIGTALRGDCHGNPENLHRAVHLFVFNQAGDLYLQRRSMAKQVQPGKWDTSVGGHISAGEEYLDALYRETHEELRLDEISPCFMYRYIMHNSFESEMISSFICVTETEPDPCPEEISEGRFWSEQDIEHELGTGLFTPNFEDEFSRFLDWRRKNPRRFSVLFSMNGSCGDEGE